MEEKKNIIAVDAQPQAPTVFNFCDSNQMDNLQRVCKMFAASKLVPEMYRAAYKPIPAGATDAQIKAIQEDNKHAQAEAVSNCMIAIDIAQRIGASPLMVMQNMVPIFGKPSWSSKFLIATVNSCGRFNPLKFKFNNKGLLGMVDYVEYTWSGHGKVPVTKQFNGTKVEDVECIAYTTQKGSEDLLESSPVSIRMAIREGWYMKNGSKWQTMPRQMLMYRAASFWTSVYAPEISMGIQSVEETQDVYSDYEDVQDVEVKPKQRITIEAPEDVAKKNATATKDKNVPDF